MFLEEDPIDATTGKISRLFKREKRPTNADPEHYHFDKVYEKEQGICSNQHHRIDDRDFLLFAYHPLYPLRNNVRQVS